VESWRSLPSSEEGAIVFDVDSGPLVPPTTHKQRRESMFLVATNSKMDRLPLALG
jgi:hypothetical protein